jgi:Tol biopolymer transport system component
MNNILKYSVLTLFVFLFSCSEEKIGQLGAGIVKGRVVTEIAFEPLENVRISSSPNSSTVFTDANGEFSISGVTEGTYSFEARKDGYVAKFESVTVLPNGTTEVVYELKVQTSSNTPPTTPVLTSPADNAINQDLNLNFTWTATDAESDALTYSLILRNDVTDEVQTFTNITTPNFTASNLNYSSKYFWQISVSDGTNSPVFSEIRAFRTKVFPDARFLFTRLIGNNSVIFAGDDTGNELQLTSSSTNSFRPIKNTQSNKIAFIQSDGSQYHIYSMNTDGSNLFKVTNTIPIGGFNFDYLKFCFNASGSEIIYPNFDKLYKINVNGSGLQQIYQTPNGKFITECDWSFDGTVIALKVNNSAGYQVELYTINTAGAVLNTVLNNISGAINGIHLSANNNRIAYCRDISGFENANYRQLDSRIYVYNFTTSISTEIPVERLSGFNDLDVRFSPNEAEFIFVNTSNDGISQRNIQKYTVGVINSRTTLFSNATMPDWK